MYKAKMSDYKPRVEKGGQRLGAPFFARIAVFLIIGLALSMAVSGLYKNQRHGKVRHTIGRNSERTFVSPGPRHREQNAQSLHLAAKSLINQGRYQEAERQAQKALSIDNRFYRAYMDLGVVYSSYGDYIKAEKAFKSALEFVGNDIFDLEIIYADFGLLYYVEKRFDEAWEYLRKAYERKNYLGKNFWADHRLIYVVKNDKNKFIEQAMNDKKLPREIYQRKQRVSAFLGRNNDAAIRDCEQFITDNPGSVYTYVFRSIIVTALERKQEYEKALDELRLVEAANVPPHYIPWIKHTYAYIYDAKGEKQRAIDYLKDIIAHHPDYESLDRVKERLHELEGEHGVKKTD